MSTSPAQYWGLVWFTLRRSCRCCHSHCESICVSCSIQRISFPQSHTWPLALSSLFTSSSQITRVLRGEFDDDIPLRTECSNMSRSAHFPVNHICISSHLLQEEDSIQGWVMLLLLFWWENGYSSSTLDKSFSFKKVILSFWKITLVVNKYHIRCYDIEIPFVDQKSIILWLENF